jgi:uncharacterized protein (TIGR03086 family)
MSEIAERYRRVAAQLTEMATVAERRAAWENAAPCAGWTAGDVIVHMVEWMPPLLARGAGVSVPPGPSAADAPLAAWTALNDGIQALLDDPATAAASFDHPPASRQSLEEAVVTFILGDVLVHTWDLARAVGIDVSLPADEVHDLLERVRPLDAALRASGRFGAPVPLPDTASEQQQLLAFLGRDPR